MYLYSIPWTFGYLGSCLLFGWTFGYLGSCLSFTHWCYWFCFCFRWSFWFPFQWCSLMFTLLILINPHNLHIQPHYHSYCRCCQKCKKHLSSTGTTFHQFHYTVTYHETNFCDKKQIRKLGFSVRPAFMLKDRKGGFRILEAAAAGCAGLASRGQYYRSTSRYLTLRMLECSVRVSVVAAPLPYLLVTSVQLYVIYVGWVTVAGTVLVAAA